MLDFLCPNVQTEVAFPADGPKSLPTAIQLTGYDGVLWTGSALSVTENIPSVTDQLDFAETVFESGTPIYGSCWGLQIAVTVAGGEIKRGENGLEFGIAKEIMLTEAATDGPFFPKRNSNYSALCIHFDEVVKIPENGVVLAYNTHSKVQALTFDYKKSSFFGVQYHPEFKASDLAKIATLLSKKLIQNDYFSSVTEANKFISQFSDVKSLPQEIVNYRIHTQEITAWLEHIE
ncbi:type 1 glutamine amidotransferase [Pricia sp. S334]|uniref:Type 1 glutamine amidotransferase n=1 Tax=Pricia mediterranea TaxID=3076079 RepID=A0ABU3L3K0_9FLAO|nr:type 1 glutamine amidotransferase [Pricia sp. S334]MDT7828326.1 type 1 glutamine amidotransferase [Pricia sp. S334]